MIRRGISLLEVMVSAILLVALMTLSLQMFAATAAQHRAARNRQIATQRAWNAMERLAAAPWDALDELSGDDAELQIEVTAVPEQPDARRIAVVVRYNDGKATPAPPVRLVAWRYRR